MKIDWRSLSIEEAAALVCTTLDNEGISATLVGGACVMIYSSGEYVSRDLDFVSDAALRDITATLSTIGFDHKSGRLFENSACDFLLDFPAPPLAIGKEPVKTANILRTKTGMLRMLTATDCIKDRLAAWFHWNDHQCLEQALNIARSHSPDMAEIARWAQVEGQIKKFRAFAKTLGAGKQGSLRHR